MEKVLIVAASLLAFGVGLMFSADIPLRTPSPSRTALKDGATVQTAAATQAQARFTGNVIRADRNHSINWGAVSVASSF